MEDAHLPQAAAKRRALAERIGEDGRALLEAVGADDAPRWLRFLPAVDTLRRIWIQRFLVDADGRVRWRTKAEGIPPTALFISSPYDVETRYAKKRTTSWIGYEVHLTETCDAHRPHLITNVGTTPAPLQHAAVVDRAHDKLHERDLLPDVHVVDTGYVNGKTLVERDEEHGVLLVGPIRRGARWQAREKTGFATSDFRIDRDRTQALCPAGRTSSSWSDAVDARGHPVVKIKFRARDCAGCPHREACTRSKLPRRTVTVRPRARHEAIEAARGRQESPTFQAEYAKRAGIEGTVSAAVRAFGLRRARYVGLAKTHLQHVLTAAALNLTRGSAWLAGERPAATRTPRFVAVLAPAGAA